MYSGRLQPRGDGNSYSAKNNAKPVTFLCTAPEAGSVALTGDFNDWDPESHPMQKRPDGSWHIDVHLSHGHHHYLFVIDGQGALDPNAQGIARNEKDEKVSLIAVS